MATIINERRGAMVFPTDRPLAYLVTDIEADGPEPGRNSMRSFASVAVSEDGEIGPAFEGCLAPLDGATPDPGTLAWLQSQPEIWADATRDPRPPGDVMQDYVDWIRGLPTLAVFVAHPVIFDGAWIDWYLLRFLGLRLCLGPHAGEQLFCGTGLDLASLIVGATGRHLRDCRWEDYPDAWFGGHGHSHRAIDDATGYAHVLAEMLRRSRDAHSA